MRAAMVKNITVIFLIVGLAIFAWHNSKPASVPVFEQKVLPTESGPEAGKLAPEFSLKGTDNNIYSVGGSRDKAVMLNFWASWCGPCQEEAPELERIAKKYRDVLDIYGINVTDADYKPNAERFIKKYGFTFPAMFDLKGEVFAKYNGAAFPTNVLINKDGVIAEVIIGTLTPAELEEKIIALTGS